MLRALDANTAFRDTSCTLRGTGNQRKSTMAHLSVLELISDLSRGLELNWEEALDRCVGGAEVKLWHYTEYEGASYIQYKGTTSYSYDLPNTASSVCRCYKFL